MRNKIILFVMVLLFVALPSFSLLQTMRPSYPVAVRMQQQAASNQKQHRYKHHTCEACDSSHLQSFNDGDVQQECVGDRRNHSIWMYSIEVVAWCICAVMVIYILVNIIGDIIEDIREKNKGK